MIDPGLAIGLILLIFALLYAGLTPFSFSPVNRVRSLAPSYGISFAGNGIAYSQGEWSGNRGDGSGSITIHLLIRPEIEPYTGMGTILSLHDGGPLSPVMVAQWKRRLVVRVRDRDQASRGYWELDAAEIPKAEQHLISITSGDGRGTSIYIDGTPTGDKRRRPLISASSDFGGKLILGCMADGRACWRGQLGGVAIIDRVLDADEVSDHYGAIREAGFSAIADTPSIQTLFSFEDVTLGAAEDTRTVVNLAAGSSLGALYIPRAFTPPAPKVLHLEDLREMKADWFLRDLANNILGFIPLGSLVAWLLYRRSALRSHWIVLISSLFGASVSLLIEVMQIYLPMRASSLSDLYINVIGSVIGAVLTVRVHQIRRGRAERLGR